MAGKYRLSTLGCKVNQYESEQVRQLLESLGMRPAQPGEHADLAIANTCAVTCSATSKSRQTLRRIAGGGTTQTIAIGCYASADPAAIARIDGVDHVLGHDDDALAGIRQVVTARLADLRRGSPHANLPQQADDGAAGQPVQVGLQLLRKSVGAPPRQEPPPDQRNSAAGQPCTTYYSINAELPVVNPGEAFVAPLREFAGRRRAFLKIQDGCDAHCTYCIIPSLRKNLRSKPIDRVVDEARGLVAAGHREIVLTGIFLGAYGQPTARRRRFAPGPSPLAALVDAVAQVAGLDRLRLSSLEPGDVDDALLAVLAEHDNCVPHLHLPLQAGSDEILRRMNRQYTLDEFHAMIARVNAALDRPAISTDIIVGFPGETDALFEQTLATARQSKFCKIHAFPFSPRPGTAANRWKNQFVHNQTVKERMQALRTVEQELSQTYRRQFIGETARVLVEAVERHNGNPNSASAKPTLLAHGRCDRYFEIHFAGRDVQPGDLVDVRIDSVTPTRVHGAVV